MPRVSKRRKLFSEKVVAGKSYPVDEAVKILKECAKSKFKEGVDVAIRLGIDVRKSDQGVRGASILPHGTGRVLRVAVFADGDGAAKATAAGADVVGMEDLAERIKAGQMDFDVVIATPASMRVVGQLGQVLGPRGLMPNPKVGTVTNDVATAVKNAKAGQVRYRTDKNGIIHCTIGKVDFDATSLQQNLETLIADLKKIKPPAAKGTYVKKVVLSSTMGPGIIIDVSSLAA